MLTFGVHGLTAAVIRSQCGRDRRHALPALNGAIPICCVALLAILSPRTLYAQTPTDDGGQSWVSEVVVTAAREHDAVPDAVSATRTDTPLTEVPQSVQVITHTLMQEQDTRTLADALVNVSGVVPTKPEEGLFIAPIIRGFPAEVYVDGLPIFGGNQQAFDPTTLVGVERVEVLKGPSSTLYGGGLGSPLGGLINMVSERPDDKFGGYVALRAGSFSTWDPYVDLNVPLASGIAARIAGEYQSNDSWIDLVQGERWSVKPSVSFQIDPRTDLLVQGQFNHRSQLEYSGLPAAPALAGQLDRNAFPGAPIGQPRTGTPTTRWERSNCGTPSAKICAWRLADATTTVGSPRTAASFIRRSFLPLRHRRRSTRSCP
jgi:iron complex outermembrane receptor protein